MFTWVYPYFLSAVCVMSDPQGTLVEKTFGPFFNEQDADVAAYVLWNGFLCESKRVRNWRWKEAIPFNIPKQHQEGGDAQR